MVIFFQNLADCNCEKADSHIVLQLCGVPHRGAKKVIVDCIYHRVLQIQL